MWEIIVTLVDKLYEPLKELLKGLKSKGEKDELLRVGAQFLLFS
jgi:hypothetical protein